MFVPSATGRRVVSGHAGVIASSGDEGTGSRPFLVALSLLFAAYFVVFAVTGAADLAGSLRAAAVNVLAIGSTAGPAYAGLRAWISGRPHRDQALSHAVLGPAYSVTLYGVLILLLAFVKHQSGEPFRVEPFTGPGLPWQLLQGLMVYAVIASLSFAARRAPNAPASLERRNGSGDLDGLEFTRYLVKRGNTLSPVDMADVLTVTGADDYCEVLTVKGRHLAHLTLTEFERRAGAQRFVRVHRSRIVNFERVASVALAPGGRMIVEMQGGETVTTSRAGAQALRARMI